MATTLTPTILSSWPDYPGQMSRPGGGTVHNPLQCGQFHLPATYPSGGFILNLSAYFSKVWSLTCYLGSPNPMWALNVTVSGTTNQIPCSILAIVGVGPAPLATGTALATDIYFLAYGVPI